MLTLSIIGILVILLMQIILFKKENLDFNLKLFIKSKELLEVFKEFLVVLLGVTIAIYLTNIDSGNQNKNKVIALLEVSQNELDEAYTMNAFFIKQYEERIIDARTMKANIKNNNSVLRNVLENDTVIIIISPFTYSFLLNNLRSVDAFYNNLHDNAINDNDIYTSVIALNKHIKVLIDAIDIGNDYLRGRCNGKDLLVLHNIVINDNFNFVEINEAEITNKN